jgi:hypothetical protein
MARKNGNLKTALESSVAAAPAVVTEPQQEESTMTETATTSTAVEVKSARAKAVKTFIDATGAEAEIEKATGLKYEALPDKKTWTYQIPDAVAGTPQTMLALFGSTTLSTNTASQNRGMDPADQFASDADAVAARFERIVQGDWGTRAGGGGLQIDTTALYDAIIVFKNGLAPPDVAAFKARLESDADWRKLMRNHPQIAPNYDAIMREKRAPAEVKPIDELLGW